MLETKLLQQLRDYRLFSKQRVRIGPHEAYRRVATITTAAGRRGGLAQFYFLAEGTAHTLTFGCPAERLGELGTLLDLIAGSYTPGGQ